MGEFDKAVACLLEGHEALTKAVDGFAVHVKTLEDEVYNLSEELTQKDRALAAANERIAELEAELSERSAAE